MQTPLRITFRKTDSSIVVEQRVRELTNKLERYCDRITGCHVVIEKQAGHSNHDGMFLVHLELTVPGGAVNASNAPINRSQHQDIYIALRDTFEAARRQLADFAVTH